MISFGLPITRSLLLLRFSRQYLNRILVHHQLLVSGIQTEFCLVSGHGQHSRPDQRSSSVKCTRQSHLPDIQTVLSYVAIHPQHKCQTYLFLSTIKHTHGINVKWVLCQSLLGQRPFANRQSDVHGLKP